MINSGTPLVAGSPNSDIVSVLNELVGDYKTTIPLSKAGSLTFVEQDNADVIWVLLCGYLVFFMHAGFSMLEAGSVRHKNAVNIMFKNIGTIAVGGLMYYLFGFAFAYGEENEDSSSFGFIGSGNFALKDIDGNRHSWFFQYAFAATGATIVSGAVAGRVQLVGYFIIAAWMTSFVYPVVSHWIWATGGFASAFNDRDDTLFAPEGCGVIDYAGSGVVHMTGGLAAFWCAFIVGPRLGRFGPDGQDNRIPPHNMALVTLGTFILWVGWYGFNTGSTLAFDGENASKAAVTTTLSPSLAAFTAILLSRGVHGHFDLGTVLNSALGGLVGITAGCTTVPDWAAVLIGIISCLVYMGSSKLMILARIDDPVDAIAVHGFCGIWGMLAIGIFAQPDLIKTAYSGRECEGNTTGLQFATQLVAVLTIIAWVTLTAAPLFVLLKKVNLLRVPPEFEEKGLDSSEHGGASAFVFEDENVSKPIKSEAPSHNKDKDTHLKKVEEVTQA